MKLEKSLQEKINYTVLIGIESGLLRGMETLKWSLASIQEFCDISALSTVLQSNSINEYGSIRVVLKGKIIYEPEQTIRELKRIEREFETKFKVMEPMRCFLLVHEYTVSVTPHVTLPHPQLVSHPAWLVAANEVWRTYRHPVLEIPIEKILAKTNISQVEFFSQGKAILSRL